MDRNLAAQFPEHADKHQMEKLGDALLRKSPEISASVPVAGAEIVHRTGARESFVGLANEIRELGEAEAAKRDEFGRKVWES